VGGVKRYLCIFFYLWKRTCPVCASGCTYKLSTLLLCVVFLCVFIVFFFISAQKFSVMKYIPLGYVISMGACLYVFTSGHITYNASFTRTHNLSLSLCLSLSLSLWVCVHTINDVYNLINTLLLQFCEYLCCCYSF
jgi:hypothetical protein